MYTHTYSIWRCHCIKYQDVEPSAIYLNENNFSKQNLNFVMVENNTTVHKDYFGTLLLCNLRGTCSKLVHSMLESTSVCIVNIYMPYIVDLCPSDTEEMEIDKPRTYIRPYLGRRMISVSDE